MTQDDLAATGLIDSLCLLAGGSEKNSAPLPKVWNPKLPMRKQSANLSGGGSLQNDWPAHFKNTSCEKDSGNCASSEETEATGRLNAGFGFLLL